MSRAIIQSTSVNIQLAFTMRVHDDRWGDVLLTWPIVSFTLLGMLLWNVQRRINRIRFEWAMLKQDITAAALFTGTLLTIGFNALAFGLGVR